MTTQLFSEFLEKLDRHVKIKIVLIMDNAPTHILAMKKVKLSNIKIALLRPNTTSKTQPLDCGIIANLKVKYQWKTS